jgi:hypothetical protein
VSGELDLESQFKSACDVRKGRARPIENQLIAGACGVTSEKCSARLLRRFAAMADRGKRLENSEKLGSRSRNMELMPECHRTVTG